MKSLVRLVSNVLADACTWCGVNTQRDLSTVARRVENEGVSFLTITLPTYSKAFHKSLEDGVLDSDAFQGFALDKRGFPRLFGGILRLIFDAGSRRVLDCPSILAIQSVKQICDMLKKLELECSPLRKRAALDGYLQCESEVREWSVQTHPRLIDDFRICAATLFGTSLATLDRKVERLEHVPKHGPGATAEKLSANGRYTIRRWHDRLEPWFPSADFAIPNYGYRDELESIDFIEPGREQPVRVILVPKTLKTPRVIAVEPSCMQYAQQSLLEMLVPELESARYHGALGFTDQTVNQTLAKEASMHRHLSTLDLSEASDRVPNLLVKMLLASSTAFKEAVFACRSTHADVLGKVVKLSKFASMGSALCFPVEAMVFLTILRLADCRRLGVDPGSRKGLRSFLSSVRVYGDDIVVPSALTPLALDSLHAYGMVVNRSKSFVESYFRESCGGDFFMGEPVKPTYLRRWPEMVTPRERHNALVSLISTRNQLYEAGWWKTSAFLDSVITDAIPFPIVERESPINGRFSFLPYQEERQHPTLHRPEVRGLITKPQAPVDVLADSGALLKFFLKRGFNPLQKGHLERYGRPRFVHTKIAWAPPY